MCSVGHLLSQKKHLEALARRMGTHLANATGPAKALHRDSPSRH